LIRIDAQLEEPAGDLVDDISAGPASVAFLDIFDPAE
jgi:hypothetical protein